MFKVGGLRGQDLKLLGFGHPMLAADLSSRHRTGEDS